jgi:hypothetical protein
MSELLDPRNFEISRRFDINFKWFNQHYQELKNNYRNKLVAIDNNKVIDSDEDIKSLSERLRGRYEDIRHIVIQYISGQDNTLMM